MQQGPATVCHIPAGTLVLDTCSVGQVYPGQIRNPKHKEMRWKRHPRGTLRPEQDLGYPTSTQALWRSAPPHPPILHIGTEAQRIRGFPKAIQGVGPPALPGPSSLSCGPSLGLLCPVAAPRKPLNCFVWSLYTRALQRHKQSANRSCGSAISVLF